MISFPAWLLTQNESTDQGVRLMSERARRRQTRLEALIDRYGWPAASDYYELLRNQREDDPGQFDRDFSRAFWTWRQLQPTPENGV